MAITKTDFINYTRCPRYVALLNIKKDKLKSEITYEEYKKEETKEKIKEILSSMFDDASYTIDNTIKENKQTEALMPYYKEVEVQSAKLVDKYFGGSSIFSLETKEQKCYKYDNGKILYLCYVDVYNENKNKENIIEVKATTINKYEHLESGYPKKDKYSIFNFDENTNCYYLKDELPNYDISKEMPIENYNEQKNKLFDRYSSVGGYVFDLAVQRYFLEGEYKNNNKSSKDIKYYLAVLNNKYVFDGTYDSGKPVYNIDKYGNELINFIDLTSITKYYLSIIDGIRKNLEHDIDILNASPVNLGRYCQRNKIRECPFFKTICASFIPEENSSLNYLNNASGFKIKDGTRIKGLDLINAGYINMLDIPDSFITNKKHMIQRYCLSSNKEYIDKEKIIAGLNELKYPIYHLDFETLPCPVPRFKGEHPYIQSVFEFSLHVEKRPGVCDKDKDNYVFLAKSFDKDEREELIKNLLKYVKPDGTLFAQNVAFEKGRIKELAEMFPKYKDDLMSIYNCGFDLLWLVNTNSKLYERLGFDKERSALPNFYDKSLSGSYSIKKTLPVFSDLSYKNLEVHNGTDAIVAYANYNNMTKKELEKTYENLKVYCKQDTWAMVVILDALRNISK